MRKRYVNIIKAIGEKREASSNVKDKFTADATRLPSTSCYWNLNFTSNRNSWTITLQTERFSSKKKYWFFSKLKDFPINILYINTKHSHKKREKYIYRIYTLIPLRNSIGLFYNEGRHDGSEQVIRNQLWCWSRYTSLHISLGSGHLLALTSRI